MLIADLTITASGVTAATTANVNSNYNAGATITAGQAVYLDGSSTWQKAIATGAAASVAAGVALHAASSGQPLAVCTGGALTIGTGTVGTVYVVSAAAAGGIAPNSDLGSGNYVTILGVLTATGVLTVTINASGTAKA